jgi:hypothetical protein
LECHQRFAAAAYNFWLFWTSQPTNRAANQLSQHANAALSCFNKPRQEIRCISQISPAPIRYSSQPTNTRLCQVGTASTTILGKMLWRLLHHFDIHLYMDFSTIPLPRERDQVLMEIFFTEDLSSETIRSVGRCKCALEAIFLSDVTTADSQYLEKFVFEPGSKNTKSKFKFPREKPPNKDWNLWFNFWHNFTLTGDKL